MKSEKQIRVKLIYTTVADSRSNGVAARLNRTLLDRCRTLLEETGLSKEFWYHAIEHVVYDLNHTYKQKLKCSPIEKAGIKPPKLKHIHAFGQLTCYRINSTSKLDKRAKLGYLLHPSSESYGYIILDAKTNKLVDTTDFRPFYKNGPDELTEKEFHEQVGEWLHKAKDKLSSTSQEENNEPEFITESHNKRRKIAIQEPEKNKPANNDSDTVTHEENLDTQDFLHAGVGKYTQIRKMIQQKNQVATQRS